jgi:hypothetical protein
MGLRLVSSPRRTHRRRRPGRKDWRRESGRRTARSAFSSFANALPARTCTPRREALRSRKERSLPGDKQVVSNGICVLAKNALLDVVQNRGLEAFTDCPGREILLNAANAKPFRELGSYLRSPGPGGHNIRRWITPASGSKERPRHTDQFNSSRPDYFLK